MKIERNDHEIEQLLKSDGVRQHDAKVAAVAAETTRNLVPSRDRDHVKVVDTDNGAAVVVDSSFWHWWEFGVRGSPARAPLRRGIESAGLDVKDAS